MTMKNRSLQRTLLRVAILPTATVILIMLSIILLGAYLIGAEIVDRQKLLIDALARQGDQHLAETGRLMQSLADSMQTLTPAQQTYLLAQTRTNYSRFSAFYLLDEIGRVLVEDTDTNTLLGLDLSREPFFQEAYQPGQVYFSDPFISLTTGQASVTGAAPIYRNGRFTGMLVGELNLSLLQQVIEQVEVGEAGVSFIVDRRGTLVAHPNPLWVQQRRNLADMRLVQKGLAGGDSFEIFYDRKQGGWFIGSVTPMNRRWIVLTTQPAAVAARPLIALLLVSGLAFGCSMVLFILIQLRKIRQLTRPISLLAQRADALAQGQYETLPISQEDQIAEITSLAQSFTRMVEAVQERDRFLEQRVADRTRRLELIASLSERLNRILDPNQLLTEIIHQIEQNFDYYYIGILLLDDSGETMSIRVGTSRLKANLKPEEITIRLDATPSLIAQAARRGQVIRVDDVDQSSNWLYDPHLPDTRSELAVPIMAEEQVIGILDAQEVKPAAFDESETDMFRSLANQIGIALHNARLYTQMENLVAVRTADLVVANYTLQNELQERAQIDAEIQRRNRELALLNRIIAASAAGAEQATILDMACRELAQAFGIAQAAAFLVDEQKNQLAFVADYHPTGQPSLLDISLPLSEDVLIQHLHQHKAPLLINDPHQDPRTVIIHPLMSRADIYAVLAVPLITAERLAGGLYLQATEPRAFSAEEVGLAWNVANQLANVLARIHLDEERRRLTEQIRQAQKMEAIGLLAGGIAHDFNNLLTSINGFAELLQQRLSPGDSAQKYAQTILHSGRRAADLTRQLLVFSRKQVVQPKVLDLNSIVVELEKMLQRLIGSHIHMQTISPPDLWPVKADPTQIEQVIVNLAVNARDAMPDGGRLTIELTNTILDAQDRTTYLDLPPGQYVSIAISDTGCGMSTQVKARIFEPFFTTKERDKGTGLGLATVFGVIKQCDGAIDVDSLEGVGTTFKIYLPRANASAPLVAPTETETELPAGNETILLVEDDPNVRELIRQILVGQGYTVLEAQDGQEGLQRFAAYPGRIDLLLTDVIMPGISGRDLAQQLTRHQPDLVVLFISGYTDQIIAHNGLLESGISFVQKPFTPLTLTRKIREALDN